MNLEQLLAALKDAKTALRVFPDSCKGADGAPRPMTTEEHEKYKALIKAVTDLNAQIEIAKQAASLLVDKALGTDAPQNTSLTVAAQPVDHAANAQKAFKTFGEQLKAIATVGMNKDIMGVSDKRLVYARSAGANETIPSEGGFLVQEDFSTRLLKLVHETGDIIRRVTNIPISSNSNALKLPTIDEISRARGSRWGGVRAYWLAEGEQKVDSKPRFGEISLGLNKIAALGYATDELLQDASAMEAIFMQAFAEEIRFEVEDSIINGNGVGKPLGIMNSGAVITVNKETSQAADTVTFNNLVAMLARLPTRSRRNAVWLINDSGLETLFYGITIPGTSVPIYLPPGHMSIDGGASVFGTLLGRPVIVNEYMAVNGDAGDILLADLTEYITIDKGGIQSAESMHVRFIYDEMTFRMVYRIDGKPAWRQPVTTANGGLTKSPFVALQAR